MVMKIAFWGLSRNDEFVLEDQDNPTSHKIDKKLRNT